MLLTQSGDVQRRCARSQRCKRERNSATIQVYSRQKKTEGAHLQVRRAAQSKAKGLRS